jgi:sugar phosphate isomerase/epimerase
MLYTRRDVGKIALAGLPMAGAFSAAKINSTFGGVRIGAISYSFNRIASDPMAIVKAYAEIGLGEVELMSNHCEALAGAPGAAAPAGGGGRAPGAAPAAAPGAAAGAAPGAAPGAQGRGARGGGRAPMTPEQQFAAQAQREAIAKWRLAASPATWKAVTKKFNDVGVQVTLLCYNMQDSMKDDDIEYGFQMAKGLGAKGITTSTTVSMSKRIAPYADKHKLLVGYHGHDQTSDPNQFATLESYKVGLSYGKFNGVNLDIGHFTAANYDAVAFIKEHHDKITNLHIKDRKKDHGPNVPWGTGDTPLKDVLQLLKTQKYKFPANIELEYPIPQGSDPVTEVKKCLAYAKNCLV